MNAAVQNLETRGPVRTCAGCRVQDAKSSLLRVRALEFEPEATSKKRGGQPARVADRGVYVHPRVKCVRLLAAGGAARSLRHKVAVDAEVLKGLLIGQLDRKVRSLFSSARAKRVCAVGEVAVRNLLRDRVSEVACLVFAKDAAGRRSSFEATAMQAGIPAYAWKTKEILGECWQRESLGVVAICDKKIANEVARAMRALAELAEGA